MQNYYGESASRYPYGNRYSSREKGYYNYAGDVGNANSYRNSGNHPRGNYNNTNNMNNFYANVNADYSMYGDVQNIEDYDMMYANTKAPSERGFAIVAWILIIISVIALVYLGVNIYPNINL